MADNPWTWEQKWNPYRNTPFQILDLDIDERGRRVVQDRIRQRRRRIQKTPERFPLFGRTLTDAEITAAESQVLSPENRLYAELLSHRPRRSSIDVRSLSQRLAGLPAPEIEVSVELDSQRLTRLVPAPTPWRFAPLELP